MGNAKKEAQKLVSIIIRTKNEERWIKSCLKAVFEQTYENFEVILVDNCSTDKTVEQAKKFPIKVVTIVDFTPGAAINLGIESSSGVIIVCLSGHCIPTKQTWLENLIFDLSDPNVAGVYGKQEPLSFTSDIDKRDLLTVFGDDRILQQKGSFFHNANSAFKRSAWDICRFDPALTNIEDRVWGKQMIARGYHLVYEPSASVYHWHGIHHGLDPIRAKKIATILENVANIDDLYASKALSKLQVAAIIPLKGRSTQLDGSYLLEKAINDAKQSNHIDQIYVATDNEDSAELAKEYGATVLSLREAELSENYITVIDIAKQTLFEIEASGFMPDIVCILEETYPFRPAKLIDDMINKFFVDGLDSILACKVETRTLWLPSEDDLIIQEPAFMPSKLKEKSALVSCLGLGFICWSYALRSGSIIGKRHFNYTDIDSLNAFKVDKETLLPSDFEAASKFLFREKSIE